MKESEWEHSCDEILLDPRGNMVEKRTQRMLRKGVAKEDVVLLRKPARTKTSLGTR